MSDVMTLRVDPVILKAKADEADRVLSQYRQKLTVIESVMAKTAGYWVGPAGEKHRQLYIKQKEKTDDVLRRWEQHPKNLRQIAGLYESTESENKSMADALTGDIIQ